MPGWVWEGMNGSTELAEVPSPTLDPLNPVLAFSHIIELGGSL